MALATKIFENINSITVNYLIFAMLSVRKDIVVKNENFANFPHIFLLGVNMIFFGSASFLGGLQAGFETFIFSVVFMFSGFICLTLCMAEMIGLFPFSGGAYGFVRVTLGSYFGHLVGCLESFGNILMVAVTIFSFATSITNATQWHANFEPCYWLLFFITVLIILNEGNYFWNFNTVLGLVIILLSLMYLVSFIHSDFKSYALEKPKYDNNRSKSCQEIELFFRYFPNIAWYFTSIETITLTSRDAIDPKTTVPNAMITIIIYMFVWEILAIFAAVSQFPGSNGLNSAYYILSPGFTATYDIPERFANIYMIIANYASAFGLTFAFGRQICAMSESRLLPNILSKMTKSNSPYIAIIFGSSVSLVILLLLKYFPTNSIRASGMKRRKSRDKVWKYFHFWDTTSNTSNSGIGTKYQPSKKMKIDVEDPEIDEPQILNSQSYGGLVNGNNKLTNSGKITEESSKSALTNDGELSMYNNFENMIPLNSSDTQLTEFNDLEFIVNHLRRPTIDFSHSFKWVNTILNLSQSDKFTITGSYHNKNHSNSSEELLNVDKVNNMNDESIQSNSLVSLSIHPNQTIRLNLFPFRPTRNSIKVVPVLEEQMMDDQNQFIIGNDDVTQNGQESRYFVEDV
eukprot:gene6358-8758_t